MLDSIVLSLTSTAASILWLMTAVLPFIVLPASLANQGSSYTSPEPQAEPKSSPEPDPEPEPEPELKPDPKSESKCELRTEDNSELKPEPSDPEPLNQSSNI